MDRNTFAQHFLHAHDAALEFARRFVVQNLPNERRFHLIPNCSYDGNPLVGDQETFPEETLPDDQFVGPFTEQQVLEWLWRQGKVPEWVNLSVVAQDEEFTYIELRCCGRFTAQDETLYHQREGHPPFHVLGPWLPPGWEPDETHSRFDLYWNKKKRNR